jgi:signal transduction histidine kinase
VSRETRDMVLLSLLGVTVAAAAGLLALRLVRRRSLALSLLLASLTPVLGVALAVLLSVRQMFISEHDSKVTLITVFTSAALSALLSVLLGRRVAAESRALGDELRDLGSAYEEGGTAVRRPTRSRVVASNRPAPAELAGLAQQLKDARERLEESRRRELELEAGRRELVAFMSHDLRTPLAGLRALAEGLEDGVIGDPKPALARMRLSVDRMNGLVDDLFELSRLSSRELGRRLMSVSVAELVDEVAALVDDHARSREVHVVVDTADADRLVVLGDSDELSRALTNLVVNAVRHTPLGGNVRLIAYRGPDQRVRVAVVDECGGIAQADLPRLFEVGWRRSADRTPDDGGAGLGLAIARGVAEAHEGTIDVENVDGGCRFELSLPAGVSQA